MIELDHQYRDKALRVREYGDSGMKQSLVEVDPVQMDKTYSFRWFGVEQARNAQQLQQQIGALNMLRTIPPELYPGYTPNFGPVLSQMVENLFGPRLAPLTFRNARDEVSVDPQVENQVLAQGHIMPVHMMDNHMEHIQVHTALAQSTGDPSGVIRTHIAAHLGMLEKQQQMNAGGPPGGVPGQGGGKPGGAGGGPKPGASPGQQRPGGQQPPGAIHQDRLKDPRVAPRL